MILGLHGIIGRHDLAAEAGATHARLIVREPFQVRDLGAQLRACEQNNLQLVLTLSLEHPQSQEFYTRTENTAKRYPQIIWQVGNEIARQWEVTAPWLDTYLLASNAIRRGNPSAKIIAGAITGSPSQMERERQRIVSFFQGAAGYYDVIDVHSYEDDYRALTDKAAWIRKQGLTAPIWSLENAGPFSDGAYSEAAMAKFVVQSAVTAFASGVEGVFWGSLVPVGGDWSDAFQRLALVDERGTLPGFYAHKILASKIAGRTAVSHDIGDDSVAIHSIRGNDVRPVFVAWSKSGREVTYSQRLRASTATVTRIPTERFGAPKPERVAIKANLFSLVVNEPVFVEFA